MKIDGSCHCGEITYQAEIAPEMVGICHCTDCQALSASAFRTIGQLEPGQFKLLSGTPKVYIKMGDSGNPREQAFCQNCGSAIYATSVGDGPKVHNIRMGTVKRCAQLPPQFEKWAQSAQEWMPIIGENGREEQQ